MRKIIIYTAILVVLTLCVIYKSDYIGVEMTELALKNNLDNTAKGAAMLVDEESYSDGYIVFKDKDIKEYVNECLAEKCDKYVIHIFDSSGKYRKYNDKGLINEESISFPYFYTDSQGMEVNIEYPSIIIEGKIQKEFYRIPDLQNKKEVVVRSAMYVVEGR